MNLENIITLVFSRFSLILHLAHHIAKFRRSCCKHFDAKRTFKLKVHCANWEREFCLWCGVGRSLRSIKKVVDSAQNPVEPPALGFIWLDKKPFSLTCIMSQSIPTGYIPPGNPRENFFERANPGHPGKFFCLIPCPGAKNDGRIPRGGAKCSQTRRNCSLSLQKIL